MDYGGAIFYVHSTFCVNDDKWLHSVSYWHYLPQHNSENKILIRYHIVWLLVVIFSRSCNKRSNARLHCFPSDKKRRKQWEGACGWINFQKTRCFFLTTLALMLLSLLVDHSYWKSLQTAETRNVRCHLLGGKYADTNHDARPLEEFLSADFPPHLV